MDRLNQEEGEEEEENKYEEDSISGTLQSQFCIRMLLYTTDQNGLLLVGDFFVRMCLRRLASELINKQITTRKPILRFST